MEEVLICKDIDEDLISFSNFLSPEDELLKRWNAGLHKLVEDLRRTLKQEYNYTVSRFRIGGSVRKKTAIIQPDYDCILFFNKIYPPFATVIQQLVGILQANPSISKIITTKYSVGFVFMKEVKVDLLPAINLVHQNLQLDGEGIIRNQRENVLAVLHGLEPSKRLPYSSSLSETQIAFMKQQSSFVHIVVKLAKFWFKVLCCDQRIDIPGLKYLIELVAVYCAQKEECNGESGSSVSATRALATVFKKLSITRHLAVRFDDQDGDYFYISPKKARRLTNKGGGFVLDPANPYNDILESVRNMCQLRQNGVHLAIRLLEGNAKQSLTDLKKYVLEYNSNPDGGDLSNLLTSLFQTRISTSVQLTRSYDFAICFTYFPDLTTYINTMKHLKNSQNSKTDDMKLIENVFRIGTKIEAYNNNLNDEEEDDYSDDEEDEEEEDYEEYDDYDDEEYSNDDYSVSGDDEYSETNASNATFQAVEAKMQDLQDGILHFLEAATPTMRHEEKIQRIFHPWGSQWSGPSVRAYNSKRHLSFQAKLQTKVCKKYRNVSVFHVPVWKGPCIVDRNDCGDDVQYICCLIVVE